MSALTLTGLDATATDSFNRARALLVAEPPSVLVTEIQLEMYTAAAGPPRPIEETTHDRGRDIAVPALAPDASSTGPRTVAVPAATSLAVYYLACADDHPRCAITCRSTR